MSCWLCGFETTELATNAKAPICEDGPCQICNAVAKVDEEINQAVVALRHLIAKRCDLRSEQNRVHGTLIHRLPVELNNQIFELLLPSGDEYGELSHAEGPVMPSYLGSVCREWRDIAWSNPSLWSTIQIVLGQHTSSGASSRISSVKDWILRSQSLPLQIVLCYGNPHSKEQFKAVIDAISQCSNRWHSLSLNIPWTLNACLPSNFQCQLLKKLRIICRNEVGEQSGPLFHYPVSPEKIEISGATLQSLQISWNHLTCAKVTDFNSEEITQLFQLALHMTHCQIVSIRTTFSAMPPIIHRGVKILGLGWGSRPLEASLLGSLTLPSLQEFQTNAVLTLTATSLPELVQRSSCPLTRLRLFKAFADETSIFDNLPPLPGVTDLVVETLDDDPVTVMKLLLDGYFPDLRHLTLRLEPFTSLWRFCLLDLKRPRSDKSNDCKILVIDQASKLDDLWNSDLGKELKALNIKVMEDGFEFLDAVRTIDK